MTQVSRKGFVDKNGQKVAIVPNVPGATEGNIPTFDENGNLQDSGKAIDTMPTANSANLVTSGGVKAALDGKRQIRQDDPDTLDHAIVSASANDGDVYITLSVREEDDIKYVRVTHDNMPNLQRALEDPDTEPTEDSDKLVTSGAVNAAINNKHALEYEDETYLSRMGVGQLNRGDDELDGASVYGKDAIRLGVLGGSVYIDAENIPNLKSALLGLEITFVRDENDDYAINSDLKEYLNDLLEEMPADKCVPCVVHAQWWNGSSYDSGHFPGALCHHSYTTTGIPRTIFLSFLGNLFYATRTAFTDFPNTWTKFENPFATV